MAKREVYPTARPFMPRTLSLPALTRAARKCQGCDLYKNATQTVFGAGGEKAKMLFVGEQPGDQEDRAGEPFVGPAGQLLDKALGEAGIDREDVYVTNAVKHFKWEPRGKRRIHGKPSARQVDACRPWLEAEIQVVNPRLIVCLGSTAAMSLMGSAFRVTQERGKILKTDSGRAVLATVHPSSLLRIPDRDARHLAFTQFVADLAIAATHVR